MSDKRIFDDPNHPQYGPVRRLWVVFAQLDLLVAAERWSRYQQTAPGASGHTWDSWIATLVETYPDKNESVFQRELIGILLEGWI